MRGSPAEVQQMGIHYSYSSTTIATTTTTIHALSGMGTADYFFLPALPPSTISMCSSGISGWWAVR